MKLTKEEFEKIVYQKLGNLPKFFLKKLENIEIFVEEKPFSQNVLGLYHGIPFPRRKNPGYSFVMPDKIILYKNTIERGCKNKKDIEKKIETVLFHEIGHYLGLNEYQLRKMNL